MITCNYYLKKMSKILWKVGYFWWLMRNNSFENSRNLRKSLAKQFAPPTVPVNARRQPEVIARGHWEAVAEVNTVEPQLASGHRRQSCHFYGCQHNWYEAQSNERHWAIEGFTYTKGDVKLFKYICLSHFGHILDLMLHLVYPIHFYPSITSSVQGQYCPSRKFHLVSFPSWEIIDVLQSFSKLQTFWCA